MRVVRTVFEVSVESAGVVSAIHEFVNASTPAERAAGAAGVVASASSFATFFSQRDNFGAGSFGFGHAAAAFGAASFAYSTQKASDSYSQWQSGTKTYEEFEQDLGDAVANFGSVLGGLAGMGWRVPNANGRIDAGELMTLAQANVVSINVNRAWQGRTALGCDSHLVKFSGFPEYEIRETGATTTHA